MHLRLLCEPRNLNACVDITSVPVLRITDDVESYENRALRMSFPEEIVSERGSPCG